MNTISSLSRSPATSQSTVLWALTAVAVYSTTAWFSEGYYHPDEHFQILEFASYKLGRMPAGDLPWEFSSQIRPGLQPLLAVITVRAAETLGISNPFIQVFVMRLVTGLLSLLMFSYWSRELTATPRCESAGNNLRFAVVLVWFFPFLSVRFSSENVAALAFWSGLLLASKGLFGTIAINDRGASNLHSEPPLGSASPRLSAVQCFLGGLLLGLSFYFRFQIAFSILGASAWVAWGVTRGRTTIYWASGVSLILTGAGVAIMIGTAADLWLYGVPVLTGLRYLQVNILQGRAAEFGVEPWWFYFRRIITNGPPPVAVPGIALIVVGLWRHRTNVMTWAFIPFVLSHIAISHKELRFLFPMILPALMLALLGWRDLLGKSALDWLNRHYVPKFWFKDNSNRFTQQLVPQPLFLMKSILQKCGLLGVAFVVALGIALDALLLPARCLMPVEESIRCFHFLYDRSRSQPLTVVSLSNIYYITGLPTYFYRDQNLRSLVAPDLSSGLSQTVSIPRAVWVSSKAQMSAPPGMQLQQIYAFLPRRPEWPSLTRGERRMFVWSATMLP